MTITSNDYASLISSLNIGEIDLSGENLFNEGRSLQVALNERVAFLSDFNGTEISAVAELRSAKLRRLTVIENAYRDNPNSSYLQVTGVLRPVEMFLGVQINGNTVPLEQLLCDIYNAQATVGNQIPVEDFTRRLKNMGFRFQSDATIMWHHFGADETKIMHAIDVMKAAGATDITDQTPAERRGRIQRIVDFGDNPGLNVESFTMGKADRSMSRTGQGFTDFIEAGIQNMLRTLRLRQLGREYKAAAEQLTGAEAEMKKAIANHCMQQSTRYTSNLGGVQRRKQMQDNGEVVEVGAVGSPVSIQYDPVNVPIGTFVYTDGEDSKTLEFWKNNTTMPTAPASPVVATATTETDTEDDEDTAF